MARKWFCSDVFGQWFTSHFFSLHFLKSQAAPCCGQDFLCWSWCEHSFFKHRTERKRQHRALSVPLCQNTPTEAKKGKKASQSTAQTQLQPPIVPILHACIPQLSSTKQTFLLMKSNLVSHCMHLGHWKTERKGKTGCYTTRWAGKSQYKLLCKTGFKWPASSDQFQVLIQNRFKSINPLSKQLQIHQSVNLSCFY